MPYQPKASPLSGAYKDTETRLAALQSCGLNTFDSATRIELIKPQRLPYAETQVVSNRELLSRIWYNRRSTPGHMYAYSTTLT